MIHEQSGVALPQRAAHSLERRASGLALDYGMALLGLWFLGGLYLDGWAHSHGKVDQSFFTPWHAVFYSGFLAIGLLTALAALRAMLRGAHWTRALPQGYMITLVAAPAFALAGVGDLLWHERFGIERGIEALLSPTHLALACSMGLIVAGPLRAAWHRSGERRIGWIAFAPAALGLISLTGVMAFMTQFAQPAVYLLAQEMSYDESTIALGVCSIVLQSAILWGPVLLALRRWRLPFGALTLIVGANTALLSVIDDSFQLIPAAIAAGLAADVLLLLLRPGPGRWWALRLCGALFPAIFTLLYFLTLHQRGGVFWSIHLWGGSVVLASLSGLLLSYLAAPAAAHTSHCNDLGAE